MKTWYERAAVIPGRSMTRSKKAFGRWAEAGKGALVLDVEGQLYIDMLCALGAISVGYQWDASGPRGVFSLPHRIEVEAAEAVLAHVAPWASSVRFTKTGSEATHAAYRIAKKATGRSTVLVGDWAYHGWHEWCSPALTLFPHGHPLFDSSRLPDVAAVFIEPHRWEPVDVDWLRAVRAFCDRVGALLVFDSMIYGGRFALGGTSEYFGVTPDLECYGKAFGNGASVAFVVGREALADHGEMVSGTYSGDVSGLSAVVETLKVYTSQPVIETLWARGRQLATGLQAIAAAHPSRCVQEGNPVHQRLRFFDKAEGERFSAAMLTRGVLWHPDVVNIMYAHTEAQIDQVIAAAIASLIDITLRVA